MVNGPPDFRGTFRTDDDARAVYSEAAGIARIIPRAVAVPADIEDVQTLVRWACATMTPLIPRGSGSSMAGAAIGDAVIVDMSRMNEIGPVDIVHRTVRVGPGVIRADIERAAAQVGLRFPPDPSSGAFCTIGGMVSTNAAGAHTLKYGPTRNWVTALDCIFDDGSRATVTRGADLPNGIPALDRLAAIAPGLRDADRASPAVHRGVRKDSSGYGVHRYAESGDVVDLLVGSEGTVAIIVGITLSLTDAVSATSAVLGAFPSLESAVTAAIDAREAGAAACELLDRTFLQVAAKSAALLSVPANTQAVLLAEVEAPDSATVAKAAMSLADAFTSAGAGSVTTAASIQDESRLWQLRHAASPILSTLGPSLTSMQFVEDSAVPPERLPEYVRGVRAALERHGVTGVIFGHAADSNIHVNPLIDVNRDDWRSVVEALLRGIVELTARLGGTLDGEHGDGRLRTPLLGEVWSREALDQFRLVKHAFDPLNIFNPGVKVPTPGEIAIGDIKYDPSLPALPARAAAALARVSADRAYSAFRFDLLSSGE